MAFLSPEYRVYVADTDVAGVVHHANYLRYFEAGRIEYLRSLGMPYIELQRQGMGFVPVHIDIHYKRPLRQDNRYCISVSVLNLKRASLIMDQAVVCDGEIMVTGTVHLACVSEPDFKAVRIPSDWYGLFEEHVG